MQGSVEIICTSPARLGSLLRQPHLKFCFLRCPVFLVLA